MQFKGIVTNVAEIEEYTDKNGVQVTKKSFVVEEENQEYPSSIVFGLFGGKAEQYLFAKGDRVQVDFSVRAYESTSNPGIFFNTVKAWKVTPIY